MSRIRQTQNLVVGQPLSANVVSWSASPDITFTEGSGTQTYDLNDDIVGNANSFSVVAGELPEGVTLNFVTGIVTYDDALRYMVPAGVAEIRRGSSPRQHQSQPGIVSGVAEPRQVHVRRGRQSRKSAMVLDHPVRIALPSESVTFDASTDTAEEVDWESRIAGPGVVWYHDFRNPEEVDAFRQDNSLNDPDDLAKPGFTRHITTDGITGGGCMELFRAAGGAGFDNPDWWRPLSPLKGSVSMGGGIIGNGKPEDDPGANGTIAPRDWDPSDSGELVSHVTGWYGHPDYHGDSTFDGTEYYLQCRVKLNSNHTDAGNPDGGKLFYFTRNDKSLTTQELVTVAIQKRPEAPFGGNSFFTMYRDGGTSIALDSGTNADQPNSDLGFCDWNAGSTANCWFWPMDAWLTLHYHIRPGLDNGDDTVVSVDIAEAGDTSYTRIWDQTTVDLSYEPTKPRGINAVICSAYMNGGQQTTVSDISHRFDQLIFSHSPIACPQL